MFGTPIVPPKCGERTIKLTMIWIMLHWVTECHRKALSGWQTIFTRPILYLHLYSEINSRSIRDKRLLESILLSVYKGQNGGWYIYMTPPASNMYKKSNTYRQQWSIFINTWVDTHKHREKKAHTYSMYCMIIRTTSLGRLSLTWH